MSIDNEAYCHVDTAGSWEGYFPPAATDIIVEILTPFDWQTVVVSSRYTMPDIAEAAELAVTAYHEREGREVPWLSMGAPFYHVQVIRRHKMPGAALHAVVRFDESGEWTLDTDEN